MEDPLRTLEVVDTGVDRPSFRSLRLAETKIVEGEFVSKPDFAMAREYHLTTKIGVLFIANQANYTEARDHARVMAYRLIYGRFTEGLDRAVRAVYADDQSAALRELGDLLDLSTGRTIP